MATSAMWRQINSKNRLENKPAHSRNEDWIPNPPTTPASCAACGPVSLSCMVTVIYMQSHMITLFEDL